MRAYHLVMLLALAAYILFPWLLSLWGSGHWYSPFLLWTLLIAAALWLEQQRQLDQG